MPSQTAPPPVLALPYASKPKTWKQAARPACAYARPEPAAAQLAPAVEAVLLDGVPVDSCLVLGVEVEGASKPALLANVNYVYFP